ncbi:MAG: FUSC family protein [Synechococcaceae cyanobacterium ELA739]
MAAALAGTLAMNRQDVQFAWYPLVAVVMCMDETDTRVLAASRTRVLGTVTGGVVAGLVHTILSGWIGLTVSLLLVVPLLRLLGWQSSRSLGMLVCSMLFLIEHYSQLDWVYVFNRILDTLLGIAAVLVVSYLFWPVNRLAEIRTLDAQLRSSIQVRLVAIRQWLKTNQSEPLAAPVPITGSRLAQQLNQLVQDELRSSPHGPGHRQRWRQRGVLWERINHHSLELQRLGRMLPPGALAGAETPWLEGLPSMLSQEPQLLVPPLVQRQSLVRLATELGLPPLLLLAVDDELQRLVKTLHSLALVSRRDDHPWSGASGSAGPS